MDIFTTEKDKGWIEIIKRSRAQDIVMNLRKTDQCGEFICITTDFLMLEHVNPDRINFIVPYSLHSNFKEMENFVRAICPSLLKVSALTIISSVRNSSFHFKPSPSTVEKSVSIRSKGSRATWRTWSGTVSPGTRTSWRTTPVSPRSRRSTCNGCTKGFRRSWCSSWVWLQLRLTVSTGSARLIRATRRWGKENYLGSCLRNTVKPQ